MVHSAADLFTNFLWSTLGVLGTYIGYFGIKSGGPTGFSILLLIAGLLILTATITRSYKTIRFLHGRRNKRVHGRTLS
jgi:hypothetical protein